SAMAAAADLAPDEVRRILQHGPWPQARPRDPTNRVSGESEAADFGRRLFFDQRLSRNGEIACATCHRPELAFTDGLRRGRGLAELERNTMGLADLALARWFGWDGANDSLWAQSLRPLLDPAEMGLDPAGLAATLRGAPDLSAAYRQVFGRAAGEVGDEDLAVDLAKALAAFQETIASRRSPFDDFRDALERGDQAAMERYPAAALRGLRLFVGRGSCAVCHFGPAFTNHEFADVGMPFFVAPGRVDPGRLRGIDRLRASPFSLLGRHNDDREARAPVLARFLDRQPRNFGEFRVPGLRNVALTAPYMHDGALASLADVVRHYSELDEERLHADGERILRPLRLDAAESADLVAFLESLTGGIEWLDGAAMDTKHGR
ncbi:MAG: hypothetical protein KIT81_13700, partial [Alphaproteobacteria bacterium]|nr:hypothetical protein [Alphaproteobacteria bacterium]